MNLQPTTKEAHRNQKDKSISTAMKVLQIRFTGIFRKILEVEWIDCCTRCVTGVLHTLCYTLLKLALKNHNSIWSRFWGPKDCKNEFMITNILTGLCVDLAKAIVTHLVHEAVEEDRWSFTVNSELSSGGVVVMLFDVSTCVGASPNSYHPEKFVDICGDR